VKGLLGSAGKKRFSIRHCRFAIFHLLLYLQLWRFETNAKDQTENGKGLFANGAKKPFSIGHCRFAIFHFLPFLPAS
jgi:hypothetical protein